MPAVAQRLSRQIEAAERSILVEVAQNVGELKRPAEMMGERKTGLALHAEHPHRQPADGAGDAVAVEIERGAIGRADVGNHIHFHAVDDGEKSSRCRSNVRTACARPGKLRRRRAAIKRVDVGAPAVQLRAARFARAGIVGNVVDGAAERIDLEHRLALGARQNPHAV